MEKKYIKKVDTEINLLEVSEGLITIKKFRSVDEMARKYGYWIWVKVGWVVLGI